MCKAALETKIPFRVKMYAIDSDGNAYKAESTISAASRSQAFYYASQRVAICGLKLTAILMERIRG